jgi:hydroxyacyl-ACP dehydratase HTD2-like protein with hotdog domain
VLDLAAQIAGWDPPPVHRSDGLAPAPAAALRDLLGRAATGGDGTDGALPPLHHWAYFLRWPSLADLGRDGHRRDGEFLPPLRDRRRMFAGGRCRFARPLRLGRTATATSTMASSEIKSGRSGELLLTRVRTTIVQDRELCVVDEQDLVYRSGASRVARPELHSTVDRPEPAQPRNVSFGPVTLFRFSVLTANSHRIHYDQPYATGVEGYPGLLVHGPLLVLTMAGLVERSDLASMSYRLHAPVFCDEMVEVGLVASAEPDRDGVVIVDGRGEVRASATFEYRTP